jgi:carboxyl-terminal processing protease
MSALDPYCQYFTKKDYEDFHSKTISGKFFGVGVLVETDRGSGYINVVTPLEDTPAFAEDILPGDKITEVDGASTKGKPLQEMIKRIKGEPNTKVTLTIWRKGRDPFQVTLTRAVIKVNAVRHQVLEGGIGYLRITNFTRMMESFDQAVADLKAKGIRALVIDLRFNGGGLLDECVKLSDRFLPEDALIVSTKGRTGGDNREMKATSGDDLPAWPLVVLVNEGTASASEIFSGAMKDHKRGALVGARTFGKGSVQTPFPLPDGSYIKLTTAKYYTPNGTSVHREQGKREYGLDPDYLVEMTADEYAKLIKKWNDERIRKGDAKVEEFKDLQLEAGLEVLRAALEGRAPKVEKREVPKDKKPSD